MITLCILIWVVVGFCSILYDMTSEIDVDWESLIVCIFTGAALGPIAFIIVILKRIIGNNLSNVVIKKRRKK